MGKASCLLKCLQQPWLATSVQEYHRPFLSSVPQMKIWPTVWTSACITTDWSVWSHLEPFYGWSSQEILCLHLGSTQTGQCCWWWWLMHCPRLLWESPPGHGTLESEACQFLVQQAVTRQSLSLFWVLKERLSGLRISQNVQEKSDLWQLLSQIKSELSAGISGNEHSARKKKNQLKNCVAGPAVYWLSGEEYSNWEVQPMTDLAYRVKWRKVKAQILHSHSCSPRCSISHLYCWKGNTDIHHWLKKLI